MNLSGPNGFICRWTSIDHVALLLSDEMDQQTSLLVNVMFDWRHGDGCLTLWPNKSVNNFSVPHILHN